MKAICQLRTIACCDAQSLLNANIKIAISKTSDGNRSTTISMLVATYTRNGVEDGMRLMLMVPVMRNLSPDAWHPRIGGMKHR